jgi:hypothetical protein
MSARRLIALLVVVVLGLLLTSPTALSRSDATPRYADGWYGTYDTTDDNDDDDPNDPNDGLVDGDDDNWDKAHTMGHSIDASFSAGGDEDGVDSGVSVEKLSRVEFGLRTRLVLLLQRWIILAGLR